jgi:hypothetical protein
VIATAKAVEKVKNAQSVRYGGEYAAWNTRGRERETNNNYRHRDWRGGNIIWSDGPPILYDMHAIKWEEIVPTMARLRRMAIERCYVNTMFHLDRVELRAASLFTSDLPIDHNYRSQVSEVFC